MERTRSVSVRGGEDKMEEWYGMHDPLQIQTHLLLMFYLLHT